MANAGDIVVEEHTFLGRTILVGRKNLDNDPEDFAVDENFFDADYSPAASTGFTRVR